MGGGGASKPPAPQPPSAMPVEDSIASKREAAAIATQRAGAASRNANDLNQDRDAGDKEPAITRAQLGAVQQFGPQPRPTGPRGDKSLRGPQAAASMSASGMGAPAIITG